MPIVTLHNSFDGHSGAFNLTNSGYQAGVQFNQINLAAGATASYETNPTWIAHGNRSLKLQTTTNSATGASVQWSTMDNSTGDMYDRFYFSVNSIPATSHAIRQFNGNVATAWIRIQAGTGRIYLETSSGTHLSNTYVTPNTWYRLESQYVMSSNGYIQLRIFTEIDSVTWSDSVSSPTFNNSNSTSLYQQLGLMHPLPPETVTLWVDEWVCSNEQNWIGPWTPNETLKQNDFEGGTPGGDVSFGNTGGSGNSPITTVSIPAGNSIQIDNTRAMHGTKSVKFVSSNGNGNFGWRDRSGNIKYGQPLYTRFYINVPALPVSLDGLIQSWDIWGSIGQQLQLTPAGYFKLYMSSGGQTLCTTPGSIQANTWYRVEVKGQAASSTAAAIAGGEIRVYVGDSATLFTSAVSTYTYSSNARGGYNGILFNGHAYMAGGYYVDDFAVSSVDWLGPYSPPVSKAASDNTGILTDLQSLTIADFKTGIDTITADESVSSISKMFAKSGTDIAKFAERTIPNVPKKVDWKTEIALTSTPNELISAQNWTDVSSFVLESTAASLRRGRSDEVSEIQPSSLSLTIDNTDGRFTPGYTGGPYGSGIDMGKMIRRSAVIDGVAYPRFTGYIDTVNIPEWANSNHFHRVVTIEASDRLARIGAEKAGPMLSAYEYEVLRLDPELFYPLTDEVSAKQLTNRSTYRFDPLIRINNAGETTLGGGDSWPADAVKTGKFEPTFHENGNLAASSDWFRGELRNPIPYGAGNPVTMCAWVTVDKVWTQGTLGLLPRIIQLMSDTTTVFLGLNFQSMWTGGTTGATASTTPIPPGTGTGPRFVAVVINPGNPVALYVDGQVYPGSEVPVVTDELYMVNVGGPWGGDIGGVAVFRQALSGAQIQDLYQAGYAGTEGMLSDEAMRLVSDYAGIDSSELVIDPPRGQTRVAKIPLAGRSRLDVMKDIVKAEGGILYVDPSGIMRFHTRGKRWNTGAAQVVIPPQEIKVTLAINYDDNYLVNEALVTRDGGVTARAVWAPSQTARGIYVKKEDGLKFFSDAEAMPRARSYVIQNNVPMPRMGALPLSITTSLIQKYLLELDIGSIISLSGLSSDAPNFGRHFIEGISESQSVDEYVITFTTSPVYAPIMAYMVVGSDWLSLVGGYSYIAP